MSKLITLSGGETVAFRPHFTHKAQMVYSAANNRGVVERETVAPGPDGLPAVTVVRERPVVNEQDALFDTVLYMVQSVRRGDNESSPTREWLESLPEPDFADLAEAVIAVKRDTDAAIAAGKKNRG